MTTLETLGITSIAFVIWFTWIACTGPDGSDGQSRRASIIEAWVNIFVGLSFNYCLNFLLLPMVGAKLTLATNFWLGSIFTAFSMLRQYAIRRWFNERIHLFAARMARRFG